MPKSRRKYSAYQLIASRLVDAADEVVQLKGRKLFSPRRDAYCELVTYIGLIADMEIPPSAGMLLLEALRKAERIYNNSGLQRRREIDFVAALNNAER